MFIYAVLVFCAFIRFPSLRTEETLLAEMLLAIFPSAKPKADDVNQEETTSKKDLRLSGELDLKLHETLATRKSPDTSTDCTCGNTQSRQSPQKLYSEVSPSGTLPEMVKEVRSKQHIFCEMENIVNPLQWKYSATGRVDIPSNSTILLSFTIDDYRVMFTGMLTPSIRRASSVSTKIHFNDVEDLTGQTHYLGHFTTSRFFIRIFSGIEEVAHIAGSFTLSKPYLQKVQDELSSWKIQIPSEFGLIKKHRISGSVEMPLGSNTHIVLRAHEKEVEMTMSTPRSQLLPANDNNQNTDMTYPPNDVSFHFTFLSEKEVTVTEGSNRHSATDAMDVSGAGFWCMS